MAIRQYIGARYVTKIYENSVDPSSAEWESGASYEPLTMVTYLNSSYLSKKAVPATIGNPADNPLYWVITGAYNGQIASLQSQIDNINNTEIPAIQGDLSDVLTEVSTKMPDMKHRNFIFIGDSYNTTDVPTGGYAITPWGTFLPEFLGLSSDQWVNSGYSGAGFVNGSPHTFLEQLQAITVDDPLKITDIVVLGGVNDQDLTSDLSDAMSAFCEYVAETYPNAIVTLGFIQWNVGRENRRKYLTLNYYYQTRKYIPNLRIIPNAFNFYHYYGSFWQTPTQGHPSVNGSRNIAYMAANFLMGADYAYTLQLLDISASYSTDDLPISSGSFAHCELMSNDICRYHFNTSSNEGSIIFSLDTPTNITSGTYYKIATYDRKLIAPDNYVTQAVGFVNTSSGYVPTHFKIKINDNTVSVAILNYDSGGYANIANVTQFAIYDIPDVILPSCEC